MKKTGILCILFLILSWNKPESVEYQVDTFLRGQYDLYNFNGNVLIAEKGKIIYKKSFGFADFDSKKILNDSSVFNLASVNKQFTAMGILILAGNNQLKLTDSLRHFFPELPYCGITIHQLLTHTSGIPDYLRNMIPKGEYAKVTFNSDMIDFLAREKPLEYFSPNEKFNYSNTGYVLLGSIIEKVSGKSYGDFLAEHIFKPLSMNHTYVYNTIGSSDEKVLNYAYGFIFANSRNKYVLPESLPEFKWLCCGDGTLGNKGVSTTTGDLFKWDHALRENLLFEQETVRKMNSPYALYDTLNKVFYGYGVMVGNDDFGSYIKHGGGCPGVRTFLINYTDLDRTFIVLSNNNSASLQIENSLANIVYGRKVLMPYRHKKVNIDSESLDKFTGTFKINGITNKFIRENTHLIKYTAGSGIGNEFLPESETKIFSSAGLDMQFEIEKTTNGEIRFFQIEYGVKRELKKEDLY
jgi:CubicO group peptidase (beta-lactamase class C family)